MRLVVEDEQVARRPASPERIRLVHFVLTYVEEVLAVHLVHGEGRCGKPAGTLEELTPVHTELFRGGIRKLFDP